MSEDTILDTINLIRKRHQVGPLVLDSRLTGKAKERAAVSVEWNGENDSEKGEVVFILSDNELNSEGIVASVERAKEWDDDYEEKDMWYKAFTTSFGKFTQVVWKSSSKIGIAIEKNQKTSKNHLVMFFDPKGNKKKQFKLNVFKESGDELNCTGVKEIDFSKVEVLEEDKPKATEIVSQESKSFKEEVKESDKQIYRTLSKSSSNDTENGDF